MRSIIDCAIGLPLIEYGVLVIPTFMHYTESEDQAGDPVIIDYPVRFLIKPENIHRKDPLVVMEEILDDGMPDLTVHSRKVIVDSFRDYFAKNDVRKLFHVKWGVALDMPSTLQ